MVVIKILLKVVVIMEDTKKKYLKEIKQDKNKYLNNALINDNKICRKMLISRKFSKI